MPFFPHPVFGFTWGNQIESHPVVVADFALLAPACPLSPTHIYIIANWIPYSETTSIPVNPRTTRPVGYAFVDVSTPSEAERAVTELNGKSIVDRKVSVQLARKPEENSAEGAEVVNGENRRRGSGRGRGKGRGRGGRSGRAGRAVSLSPLF